MMNRTEQILASIDQKLLRIAKALEEMNGETINGGVYSVTKENSPYGPDWEVIKLNPRRKNEETESEQD